MEYIIILFYFKKTKLIKKLKKMKIIKSYKLEKISGGFEAPKCGTVGLEFLEKSGQIFITPMLPFLNYC